MRCHREDIGVESLNDYHISVYILALCNGEAKGVAEKGRMPLARLQLRLTTLITVSILYGIATGVHFEENQSGSEPHGSLS